MHYSNYEDYMRMVLGYPVDNNTYQIYNNNYSMMQYNNDDLEEFYPEIYKRVNPLVCSACDNNEAPITKELVDNLTVQICDTIEKNMDITAINLNIEMNRDENKRVDNRNHKEPMREDRQRVNNPLLKDLVRILILNRLLGYGRPPYRPPMPPPPPRPPYPGGPGRPPHRDFY